MKAYKVKIKQQGICSRTLTIIAACSIDALLIARKHFNANERAMLAVTAL